MSWFRGANLALAFFLELVMIVAFSYWGFHTGGSPVLKATLGVGVPLLVIVFWGIFMAPRSPRQFKGMTYLISQVVIFGLAVAALTLAMQPILALIFGVLVLFNIIALRGVSPANT